MILIDQILELLTFSVDDGDYAALKFALTKGGNALNVAESMIIKYIYDDDVSNVLLRVRDLIEINAMYGETKIENLVLTS